MVSTKNLKKKFKICSNKNGTSLFKKKKKKRVKSLSLSSLFSSTSHSPTAAMRLLISLPLDQFN